MPVFYRKWRPQTLSEVAGQEQVTRTLLNALRLGRVAHAYLFSGPRGTGKTSTGRILAKAVNCLQNGGQADPCNQCPQCADITQGRAMDVVEVDAASNRGIDEIRSLRERVAFSPGNARYKVYIIDEVHMLTEAASNALLKTLEEPPAHVIFILCTTEPHKVLPTILSRCQRFDFRRLSLPAIVSRLSHIASQESLSLTAQALELIARAASGSLRDAENLLEQLVSYYGPAIDLPQVQDLLGLREDIRARELVRHIMAKELALALALVNRIASEGVELRSFQREVVEYLRGLLLVKGGSKEAVTATAEELAEMEALCHQATLEDIVRATRLLSSADLRWEGYATLPLELALAEAILPPQSRPQSGLPPAQPVRPKETVPAAPVRKTAPVAERASAVGARDSASPSPPVAPLRKTAPVAERASAVGARDSVSPSPPIAVQPVRPAVGGAAPAALSLDYLKQNWKTLIKEFHGLGSQGNLDALLRQACQPVAVEGDTIVLGFYSSWHKEKVEDPKYCHMVERRLSEIFQSPCKVRCVLTAKEKKEHLVRAALEMGARIIEGEQK